MRRLIPLLAVFFIGAGGVDRPLLVDAARNADKEALRTLLKQGANVNAPEADGTTALHWATYRDDLEGADLLIRAGAKVNAANDLGATPLWTASQNANAAMVRRLLQAGANPNAALLLGETVLMAAAHSGNPDIVEQLIARGANVNARAARGQTALMWSVGQKHAAVVKVLLAHGADVHARSDEWSQVQAVPPHGLPAYNQSIPHGGETALMFAARVGDLTSAKLLVAAGANVNDADAWGVSATVLAEHSGFDELVEFLLDHGADPNAAKAGFTALHEAIMRRDEKTVTVLLAHGADPNAPLRTWTPTRRSSDDFHFGPDHREGTDAVTVMASRSRGPSVMRLLLKQGADPLFVHHAQCFVGLGAEPRTQVTTALLAAVGMGGGSHVPPDAGTREALTLEAVKLAVELGVDVNAANATAARRSMEPRPSSLRPSSHFSSAKAPSRRREEEGTNSAGGEIGDSATVNPSLVSSVSCGNICRSVCCCGCCWRLS